MAKITIAPDGQSFDCAPGDTILRAALRAGFGMNYSCNVGSCGNCRFELLEGAVTHQRADSPAWSERDLKRNRWLGCQAEPVGDCTIKFRADPSFVANPRPMGRSATLLAKTQLTRDITEFTLEIQGDYRFRPGQYALIGAFFANIGLNPLMMFGIPGIWDGMGFDGIAAATVISQTGVMVFIGFRLAGSTLIDQRKFVDILPNLTVYRQILAQLLPTTFTMLVMFTAGFIVQFYLKTFGTSAVAAYGVALRVEQLFLLPVFGLTGALLPIAAQNFGAGEKERVRIALFTCWKFGWLFMFVACPILYFAAPLLMRTFTPDPDVIEIGVSYLRVDGFILPIYMMLFAINSFLQALKKPIWTLLIGIYRQAFGVAFFSYIFVYIWGFGVIGVWFGIATSVLSGLILSLILAHHAAKPLIGGIFTSKHMAEKTG